jgi:hypothetical protein
MAQKKLSAKEFATQVESLLAECSPEQLRGVLRHLAGNVLPEERDRFLADLREGRSAALSAGAASLSEGVPQEELLAEIADLAHEMEAQAATVEDWLDQSRAWDDEGETLGPYERFVEPLAQLFGRAGEAFARGELRLARQAYDRLFALLETEDDYSFGVRPADVVGVDLARARARYLRAVCETAAPGERLALLYEQMRRLGPGRPQSGLREGEPRWREPVKLADLVEAGGRPLPEQSGLLRDWQAFLRGRNDPDADRWLREAVCLGEGTAGLAELARQEGKQRPRAYLDWVAALRAEGEHRAALAAANEALQALPPALPLRAAVADHLCASARALKDLSALQRGLWEAFAARPVLERLLDLWDGTPPAQRRERLGQAARHLDAFFTGPSRRTDTDVEEAPDGYGRPTASGRAHAHLLAGEPEAARALAERRDLLEGWRSPENAQGAVVPALLYLLSGEPVRPNVSRLFEQSLRRCWSGGWDYEGKPEDRRRLALAYEEARGQVQAEASSAEALLNWCADVARQRAIRIVEKQRRDSYLRAGVLVAACAEVLRQHDRQAHADRLLSDLRGRFPRHRAFLQALEDAEKNSPRLHWR